jgi:hypothetical protein
VTYHLREYQCLKEEPLELFARRQSRSALIELFAERPSAPEDRDSEMSPRRDRAVHVGKQLVQKTFSVGKII